MDLLARGVPTLFPDRELLAAELFEPERERIVTLDALEDVLDVLEHLDACEPADLLLERLREFVAGAELLALVVGAALLDGVLLLFVFRPLLPAS